MEPFCSNCGAQLTEGAGFCMCCGAKIMPDAGSAPGTGGDGVLETGWATEAFGGVDAGTSSLISGVITPAGETYSGRTETADPYAGMSRYGGGSGYSYEGIYGADPISEGPEGYYGSPSGAPGGGSVPPAWIGESIRPKEPGQKRKPDPKKPWIAIAISAFAVALVILAVFLFLRGLPSRRAHREVELGQQCMKERQYDEALLHFQEAVKIDDAYADAYLGLGDAYYHLAEEVREDDPLLSKKYYQYSREAYEKVLELSKDNREAAYVIELIDQRLEEDADAPEPSPTPEPESTPEEIVLTPTQPPATPVPTPVPATATPTPEPPKKKIRKENSSRKSGETEKQAAATATPAPTATLSPTPSPSPTPTLTPTPSPTSAPKANVPALTEGELYLLDAVQPYQASPSYTASEHIVMGGYEYEHGYTCKGYQASVEGNIACFNLNGEYASLTFTAGIVEPSNQRDPVTISVLLDGVELESFSLTATALPEEHTVNIEGGSQLILAVNDGRPGEDVSGTYGLADIRVSQKKEEQAEPETVYEWLDYYGLGYADLAKHLTGVKKAESESYLTEYYAGNGIQLGLLEMKSDESYHMVDIRDGNQQLTVFGLQIGMNAEEVKNICDREGLLYDSFDPQAFTHTVHWSDAGQIDIQMGLDGRVEAIHCDVTATS